MAYKGTVPPQGYGTPPPYTATQQTVYAPPGSAVHVQGQGAAGTTVIVKPSKGLFGRLEDSCNYIGNKLDKGVDYVVDNTVNTPLMRQFATGNVLQLVSGSSGRCLQIVQSQAGRLVVDGCGVLKPDAYNTHWTVVSEANLMCRLHNNNNYLAIVNGMVVLMPGPPTSPLGVETKFFLCQRQGFMTFESVKEPGRHVAILPDGSLKPALAAGRDIHANFGLQLVYSPYSAQAMK